MEIPHVAQVQVPQPAATDIRPPLQFAAKAYADSADAAERLIGNLQSAEMPPTVAPTTPAAKAGTFPFWRAAFSVEGALYDVNDGDLFDALRDAGDGRPAGSDGGSAAAIQAWGAAHDVIDTATKTSGQMLGRAWANYRDHGPAEDLDRLRNNLVNAFQTDIAVYRNGARQLSDLASAASNS